MRISMKAARVNNNLSLEDVSKKMGVSKSTVNRWENDIIPIPQDMFIEYCGVCDIDTKRVKANIKIKGEK